MIYLINLRKNVDLLEAATAEKTWDVIDENIGEVTLFVDTTARQQ